MKNYFLVACLLVTFFAASSQTLILCDKTSGANYLSKDNYDGYYDRVNTLELAIQLKNDSLDLNDRSAAITQYKKSYQNEVLNINAEESKKLTELFNKLFEKINALNDNLLPDTIRLIVVKGDHYGATTFFTRGDAIVTSRASLANMPPADFEHVMLHELSHIISRFYPELRHDLYEHLGFQKIEEPILILNEFYKTILYNPDGVLMDYAIPLNINDSTEILFVPVIFTKATHFDPKQSAFFGYLNFQLMPIDKVGDVYFMRDVTAANELDMALVMKNYFARITLNTQYIIHADEILADNFMYLFRTPEANKNLDAELLSKLRNSFGSFQK